MTTKPKFPFKVQRGSVSVQIYRQTSPKGYDVYTLSYYEDGQRKRPSFADLGEARKEAQAAAERLARGERDCIVLRDTEALEYVRAQEFLLPIGVPLDSAANEYAQGMTMLNGKGSILEAVRFFVASNANDVVPVETQELVNHLIETRERNHASKRHLQDLRSRLTQFATAFRCEVHRIRADQVQDYLLSLRLSPRSINNHRMAISNLIGHARLRGNAPKNFDPLAGIPWAKEVERDVSVFTPDEVKSLFANARPEMVPYLALAAFAGLRQSEIAGLDWTEIKDDHIRIMGGISKTKTKRQVPILPNLAAWLAHYRRQNGPVVPFANRGKPSVQID